MEAEIPTVYMRTPGLRAKLLAQGEVASKWPGGTPATSPHTGPGALFPAPLLPYEPP